MMHLLICLMLISKSLSLSCFAEAVSNLTDFSNCTLTARQNLRCAYPDYGIGVKYFYMSCDGSKNYDLQTEVFGDSLHEIQINFQDMMNNLSTIYDIKVNCLIVDGEGYDILCSNKWRIYNILTCNMTTVDNETISEFPEYLICNSHKYNISSFLILFILLLVLF